MPLTLNKCYMYSSKNSLFNGLREGEKKMKKKIRWKDKLVIPGLPLFVTALWVDSAGIHVSAVLSHRPAASFSVCRLQLSLHLDPCRQLHLRST